jgi:hypothetical protein
VSIPLPQYWTSPNGNRARTTYIVFHHAAYTYPVGGAVQSIYNYHRSRWPAYNACGYHIICQQDADGIHAYQVNPHDMQGAGVAERNHECYHVCCATNFTGTPSDAWLDAGAAALADAKRRYPQGQIVGHKEIALPGYGTTCPGALWTEWKPRLLARVNQLLALPGAGLYRVLAPMWISETPGPFGPIALAGAAIVQAGELLPIDQVKDGYAHLESGVGFLPIGGLERL